MLLHSCVLLMLLTGEGIQPDGRAESLLSYCVSVLAESPKLYLSLETLGRKKTYLWDKSNYLVINHEVQPSSQCTFANGGM